MTRNPVFEKALSLLAHPACLAALGLLLLNDHLLRRMWPSWWTGKLGDVAWLMFAPFALAAIVSWLVRNPRHEGRVFGAAFGLTGLVFAAVKLSAQANHALMGLASVVVGIPLSTRVDPTDLLALPALGFGILLWRRWKPASVQPRAAIGMAALPLAALLTIANSPAPDPGIYCLTADGAGAIKAHAEFTSYQSTDGGRSWVVTQHQGMEDCPQPNDPGAAAAGQEPPVFPGPAEGERYRYIPGKSIQRATGGGKNWETIYSLEPVSQAEETYYRKRPVTGPISEFKSGPLHALADPFTGNMLFAMGQQGVLVHTQSGEWIWSSPGIYQRSEHFPDKDAFLVLVGAMFPLALGLALLVFSTLSVVWLGAGLTDGGCAFPCWCWPGRYGY